MQKRGITRNNNRNTRAHKSIAEALEPRRMLSAQLVKDINTEHTSSDFLPGYFSAAGSVAYFTDDDGINGEEVWKTDGTAANTVMVKDVNPGPAGSYAGLYTTINGVTYFVATEPTDGTELWRTDGTASGTYLLKDIWPGANSSSPSDLTAYNGELYFFANDGVHGRELWVSDGTTGGTQMLVDTDPGSGGYFTQNQTFSSIAVTGNNTLFFIAYNGTSEAIYTTTGAVGNETLVKVPTYAISGHGLMPATNNLVFYDDILGYIYQSDGTSSGTVTDDATNSSVTSSVIAGTSLFYTRSTGLYAAGSGSKQTVVPASGITLLGAVGSTPFYYDNSAVYGYATVGGFYSVAIGVTATLGVAANGSFYFVSGTSTVGYTLYKTNGLYNAASLGLVDAGGALSAPSGLAAFGSDLLFISTDATNGTQPWISNGTTSGTHLLKSIYPGDASSSPLLSATLSNGKVIFSANDGLTGIEPWVTDGTSAGTVELKDINPGSNISSPSFYSGGLVGNLLYFSALDATDGYGLWVTDGTPAGTNLVYATHSTVQGVVPLGYVNGWMMFSAYDGIHGAELWRTDGTTANTQLVDDIYSGATSSNPKSGVVMSGYLYFTATDATHGTELWRTDGTAANTALVSDIIAGSSSSSPTALFVYNNTLLFAASATTSSGAQLFRSDGTAAGTYLVKTIRTNGAASPAGFVLYNGLAFFQATDSTGTSGIWSTDGTAAGTNLLADDTASNLTTMNGKLYFVASDGVHANQLFVSAGTPGTTAAVDPADAATVSGALYPIGGRLFFSGDDGSGASNELWSSDGTAAGTAMVQDLNPGFPGGVSGRFFSINSSVLVAGDNGVTGQELYAFPDIYAPEVYAAAASVVTNTITFSFSENVSADLSASSLQLQDLTTNTSVAVASTGFSYNTATNTATFTLPAAAALSIGRYRATIPASLLADAAGNVPASNATLEFLSVYKSADPNAIIVEPSMDNLNIQAIDGGNYFSTPIANLGSVIVTGNNNNDSLSITLGTNPLPGGYSFNGGGGTNTITVIGQTGSHTLSVSAAGMQFENILISAMNVRPLILDPNGGTDAITDSTALAFPSASATGRTISSLNLTGTLDINNNSLDLPGAALASITAAVKSGFNTGTWNGTGIASSAAAGNSLHLSALGVVLNNQLGTALFSSSKLFDGTSPAATDVLVKFTYYGDTNFDGRVDGTDYSRIDVAYTNHTLTGWFNGDFNYDGVVDGSDYTLIDNAFNQETATFFAQLARPAAMLANIAARYVPPQYQLSAANVDKIAVSKSDARDLLDRLNAR